MQKIHLMSPCFIVAGLVVAGCQKPHSQVEFPTTQSAPIVQAKQMQAPAVVEVHYKYLVYVPGGPAPAQGWPLVLFLHGAGERGSDLDLVKVHGPPKMVEKGKVLPFILVSPQCPSDSWWDHVPLAKLLDEVEAGYPVDRTRIYVTGLSMGGYGTWNLACYQPKRFAAIAPICGGGVSVLARFVLKHMPVWAFHSEGDPVVPLEESQRMVDAIKLAGGNPKLTVYPGISHDAWTATYNNPEFWSWLLSQSRANPER